MVRTRGFWILVSFVWPWVAARATSAPEILVLGVIASEEEAKGVALVKDLQTQKVFAARVGQEVAPTVVIRGIAREYVTVRIGDREERVRVGEAWDRTQTGAPQLPVTVASEGGIERRGDVVRISASLREHVIKRNLNQVLMQAAAVPHYVGGELRGFTLWEIDKGSVYELAGFVDGDTITAINGQPLTDVGNTIRMLHSLKDEARAEVTLVREGQEKTLQLEVQ